MTKFRFFAFIGVFLFVTLFGCEKNPTNQTDEPDQPDQTGQVDIPGDHPTDGGDQLTKEQNLSIEQSSVPTPNLKDILDPNGNPLGQSIMASELELQLIRKLLYEGHAMSALREMPVGDHPNEGKFKPSHKGFAYSYGQRTVAVRDTPKVGTKLHRNYYVFGTDCSGFIINLFRSAGVEVDTNSTVQGGTLIPNIKTALEKNTTYNTLKLEDVPTNEPPQSGDLIVWSSHIGIVFLEAGRVRVFQSNGNGTPKDQAEQDKNIGPKRGVHPFDLATMIQDPSSNYWGKDYKLYRLKETQKTFTDPRDGQVYPYKKIGTQVWMTKNLNYAAPGSWCYDNNVDSCIKYGRLYDWNTALTVAPPGWHLPSYAEWIILADYLGGNKVAGGKMKTTTGWDRPNTGATNSSGFAAFPGGYRDSNGNPFFGDIQENGYWWSSTEGNVSGTKSAWVSQLNYFFSDIKFTIGIPISRYYFSVRCIKD